MSDDTFRQKIAHLCRLCHKPSEKHSVDLQEVIEPAELMLDVILAKNPTSALSIALPDKICGLCYADVQRFQNFKKQFDAAQDEFAEDFRQYNEEMIARCKSRRSSIASTSSSAATVTPKVTQKLTPTTPKMSPKTVQVAKVGAIQKIDFPIKAEYLVDSATKRKRRESSVESNASTVAPDSPARVSPSNEEGGALLSTETMEIKKEIAADKSSKKPRRLSVTSDASTVPADSPPPSIQLDEDDMIAQVKTFSCAFCPEMFITDNERIDHEEVGCQKTTQIKTDRIF